MNTEQVQPEEESKEGGKPKKENDTEKERKTHTERIQEKLDKKNMIEYFLRCF